jgi:hypothetical protein
VDPPAIFPNQTQGIPWKESQKPNENILPFAHNGLTA